MKLPTPPKCYSKAKKPLQLSDPGYDFGEEELAAILAKDIHQLVWHDYQNLFGPYLPAGTYEELRYYVPHFVEFLCKENSERVDLINSWVGFTSIQWNHILGDDAEDYVREVHLFLLREWTKTFYIKPAHKSQDRVSVGEWIFTVEVLNVMEYLSLMWEHKVHRELVLVFLKELADFGDDLVKCAWFVQISQARYSPSVVGGRPPNDIQVREILEDKDTISKAIHLVLENDIENGFWYDAFNLIGWD